jgi:hypothetical protein
VFEAARSLSKILQNSPRSLIPGIQKSRFGAFRESPVVLNAAMLASISESGFDRMDADGRKPWESSVFQPESLN